MRKGDDNRGNWARRGWRLWFGGLGEEKNEYEEEQNARTQTQHRECIKEQARARSVVHGKSKSGPSNGEGASLDPQP